MKQLVFLKNTKEGTNYATHGDAGSAYNYLKSFDFILIFVFNERNKGDNKYALSNFTTNLCT